MKCASNSEEEEDSAAEGDSAAEEDSAAEAAADEVNNKTVNRINRKRSKT